jgi:hypothetical protein
MVLPLIPLMGKRAFQPFLQALGCSFLLVRHRKHYNVCSLVCSEYSRKWRFALMQEKSYILQFSLNPRERNLIYNWHIGDDKIPSSDNCCHLGIEMNSRLKATERTT